MQHTLLWLAHLGLGLVFVAIIISLTVRRKKPLWRILWPILAALAGLISLSVWTVYGALMLKYNIQPKWLFWYGLTLTIVYLAGSLIILKMGLKNAPNDIQVARTWPRVKLVALFGGLLILYSLVLNQMDLRSMNNLANVRIEATSNLMNLLPARLPSDLNSFPVYKASIQSLGNSKKLPKWFLECCNADFDAKTEEVARFLENHKQTLKMISQAATLPGFYPPLENINFHQLPVLDSLQYRKLALLLGLSARYRALNHDLTGAMQDLASLQSMSRHIRSYPLLISLMSSISYDTIRIQTLEHILAHTKAIPSDIFTLPVRTHPSLLSDLRQVIKLEGQGKLQGFTVIAATNDITDSFTQFVTASGNPSLATKVWRVFILPSEIYAARDLIAFNMSQDVATYSELKNNLKKIEDALEDGQMGILTAVGTPDLSNFVNRAMIYDAHRGLADLALAISAYQSARGNYPQQAIDLLPHFIDKLPLDPFDNQPLKIRPIQGAMEIYSSGLDPKTNQPIRFYLGSKADTEFRLKPLKEKLQKTKKE